MLLFDDVDASDINTLSVTSADGSVVETIQDKADGSKNTTEMVMVNGQYGALTLYGSGSWTYTVNSEHQDVQALILGESLIEEFSVSYSDGANLSNPVSAQEKIEVTLLGSFVVGPPLEPTIFSDENDLLGFDFASYNFVESYEHAINNGNGLSLREAVILSNNYDLELANTLYLSEGNYTLSLAGAYEDFAATGDLDILSNLNIQGAGVGKTTIDGGGIDRVFDLDGIDAQLNLNDLTLTGGKVTQQNNDDDPYAQYGGGIRASNQATLNLENTEVVGNDAKFGGGINGNISAEININNSSIANNLASQRGGGFYVANSSDLTINNSTIANNEAFVSGGGIYAFAPGDITINQSTISSNIGKDSISKGGGFYARYLNDITRELEITNSTFSYNEANQQGGDFTL
jgi:VCBS repeat-containing protein